VCEDRSDVLPSFGKDIDRVRGRRDPARPLVGLSVSWFVGALAWLFIDAGKPLVSQESDV
jgi:hypothetical protein